MDRPPGTHAEDQRREDRGATRMRLLVGVAFFGSIIVAFAVYPLLAKNVSFAFYLMLWFAMVSALNIAVGFTGYMPFGYVAFYGIGSYAAGVCYKVLQWPIELSLVAAGVGGVLLSLLFAPTLRLRGVYFGIVSLALATICRLVIANLPEGVTGGSSGIILAAANNPVHSYYVMWGILATTLATVLWLAHSALGKALKAIRDDAEAAAVVGVNVPRTRLKAWMLSALFPALIGGVEAWYTNVVDPEAAFSVLITAKSIVYAMAGGFGTVTGPVVGAMVLLGIDHFIWLRFPLLNLFLLGLVIVLLMLFLPRGIVGTLLKHKPQLRRYIP
jgi:branched-chain amino acid transport system permease protein